MNSSEENSIRARTDTIAMLAKWEEENLPLDDALFGSMAVLVGAAFATAPSKESLFGLLTGVNASVWDAYRNSHACDRCQGVIDEES